MRRVRGEQREAFAVPVREKVDQLAGRQETLDTPADDLGDTRAGGAFLKHRFGIGEGERATRQHFDRLPASHELPLERPARIGIKKLQAAMPGEFARVRGLAMTFEIAGRGHGQDRCFDEVASNNADSDEAARL
jgi:hypothetical protein